MAALEARDAASAISVMFLAPDIYNVVLREPLPDIFMTVMEMSGNSAARRLKKTLRVGAVKTTTAPADKASIKFEFDTTNPEAVRWVEEHATELIADISETTREQIRLIISEGFTEGRTIDEMTADLEDAVGDSVRAERIARTETMRASNEGQSQLWDQAIEEGLLNGDEQKEWIVTPDDRLCPVCEPMDGVTVGLNDDFDVEGDAIQEPPAHPNCRCTVGLSIGS